MKHVTCLLGATFLLASLLIVAPSQAFYDQSEANECASCHYPTGAHMKPVVDKWKLSRHSKTFERESSNTYCAKCHAPFQADANATFMNNEDIALSDWQSITCLSCHPPYPRPTVIAKYNVDTGDHTLLDLSEANVLCTSCHTGDRHAVEFGKIGMKCVKKGGALCINCHMAKIPIDSSDPNSEKRAAHDFKVEGNLPYSCGVNGTGCHEKRNIRWAIKKIAKWRIHK